MCAALHFASSWDEPKAEKNDLQYVSPTQCLAYALSWHKYKACSLFCCALALMCQIGDAFVSILRTQNPAFKKTETQCSSEYLYSVLRSTMLDFEAYRVPSNPTSAQYLNFF